MLQLRDWVHKILEDSIGGRWALHCKKSLTDVWSTRPQHLCDLGLDLQTCRLIALTKLEVDQVGQTDSLPIEFALPPPKLSEVSCTLAGGQMGFGFCDADQDSMAAWVLWWAAALTINNRVQSRRELGDVLVEQRIRILETATQMLLFIPFHTVRSRIYRQFEEWTDKWKSPCVCFFSSGLLPSILNSCAKALSARSITPDLPAALKFALSALDPVYDPPDSKPVLEADERQQVWKILKDNHLTWLDQLYMGLLEYSTDYAAGVRNLKYEWRPCVVETLQLVCQLLKLFVSSHAELRRRFLAQHLQTMFTLVENTIRCMQSDDADLKGLKDLLPEIANLFDNSISEENIEVRPALIQNPRIGKELIRFVSSKELLAQSESLFHGVWNLASVKTSLCQELLNTSAFWPSICSRLLATASGIQSSRDFSLNLMQFSHLLWLAWQVLSHPQWPHEMMDMRNQDLRFQLMPLGRFVAGIMAEHIHAHAPLTSSLHFLRYHLIYLSRASLVMIGPSLAAKSKHNKINSMLAGLKLPDQQMWHWRMGLINSLLLASSASESDTDNIKSCFLTLVFSLVEHPDDHDSYQIESAQPAAVRLLTLVHEIFEKARSHVNSADRDQKWKQVCMLFHSVIKSQFSCLKFSVFCLPLASVRTGGINSEEACIMALCDSKTAFTSFFFEIKTRIDHRVCTILSSSLNLDISGGEGLGAVDSIIHFIYIRISIGINTRRNAKCVINPTNIHKHCQRAISAMHINSIDISWSSNNSRLIILDFFKIFTDTLFSAISFAFNFILINNNVPSASACMSSSGLPDSARQDAGLRRLSSCALLRRRVSAR